MLFLNCSDVAFENDSTFLLNRFSWLVDLSIEASEMTHRRISHIVPGTLGGYAHPPLPPIALYPSRCKSSRGHLYVLLLSYIPRISFARRSSFTRQRT